MIKLDRNGIILKLILIHLKIQNYLKNYRNWAKNRKIDCVTFQVNFWKKNWTWKLNYLKIKFIQINFLLTNKIKENWVMNRSIWRLLTLRKVKRRKIIGSPGQRRKWDAETDKKKKKGEKLSSLPPPPPTNWTVFTVLTSWRKASPPPSAAAAAFVRYEKEPASYGRELRWDAWRRGHVKNDQRFTGGFGADAIRGGFFFSCCFFFTSFSSHPLRSSGISRKWMEFLWKFLNEFRFNWIELNGKFLNIFGGEINGNALKNFFVKSGGPVEFPARKWMGGVQSLTR